MSAALPLRMVEKFWGRDVLPPPFVAPPGQRIGEVWFEPSAELDGLLVKYIFAGEKLSIQLHPSDAQALAAGLGQNGKEECWLVIDAEPGAVLAVGFAEPVDAATIRAAALDGSIEHLLAWREVRAGDFLYLPANTVHAIGAGVSLVEIQQNSDITWRLYDYGRGRELHLDAGLAVASGLPHDPALRRHLPERGHVGLVDGPFFRLDRLDGAPDAATASRYRGAVLAIPLAGSVAVAGETIAPGACAMATSLDAVAVPDGSQCLVAQPVT
jgi:mannose-6-phosphate isomerase